MFALRLVCIHVRCCCRYAGEDLTATKERLTNAEADVARTEKELKTGPDRYETIVSERRRLFFNHCSLMLAKAGVAEIVKSSTGIVCFKSLVASGSSLKSLCPLAIARDKSIKALETEISVEEEKIFSGL
jgi:hypothetical protein